MPGPARKSSGIQPVLRALRVMEALNGAHVVTLEGLHRATALPKPTLVRLLDTLISAGYVQRVSRRAGYSLAERVLRLSSGFRHADRVVEAAKPFLHALTATHKWPVALATFDGNAMFVRAGTRYHSPFSTDSDFLNQRLPMLVSALGRAYLAFCPEGEQRTILDVLRASTASADVAARDTTYVERLIAGIRARGYASTAPIPGDPAMGIAVPIMEGEHAAATMTMRYFASVMSEEEAAERYLVPMQHAAAAIAANLQETSIEVSGA